MLTYQDFEKAVASGELLSFLTQAIEDHRRSDAYKIAVDADLYEKQLNVGINDVVKKMYTAAGVAMEDYTSANNKIASNYFHRLNTQRVTYSLGNGVTFTRTHTERQPDGSERSIDDTKALFTQSFDTDLSQIAKGALEHGAGYGYIDRENGLYREHFFPLTEFVPLVDEDDGRLRAGVRFWCLDWGQKPVTAVLYEEDGFTKYRSEKGTTGLKLEEVEAKRAYNLIVATTEADGAEVIGEENYSGLPIVPLYGNRAHQSTLVGLRAQIDTYDMIASGFANDLEDCAQVYWMIANAQGMSDDDLAAFRDRLKFQHIAVADQDNSSVTPYTQDIPYQARSAFLGMIEASMYRDFGAFNPTDITAGQKTATEINAAYQPMDEEADAFEYQIIQHVQQVLKLIGVEDTPQFKRNRIANQMEQTNMILSAAEYLDEKTLLELLPFITVDKIEQIMAAKALQEGERLTDEEPEPEPTEEA